MNILVMGTGAVGGYFGARLAMAGNRVHFIARGTHLETIKSKGLKILSSLGDFTVKPVKASNNPQDFYNPDIILFCVKTYDCLSASKLIQPIVGPDTTVIPFLNGIGHIETMQSILTKNNVVGGIAMISALIEQPGVIRQNGKMEMLKFGELDNTVTPRIEKFQSACEKAGINNSVSKNIQTDLWQKYLMICTIAGANCLTRMPLGKCRNNPFTRKLMENIALEIIEVAKAENIILPNNQIDLTMKLVDSLPDETKASTLPALEKGQKLEIASLNGAIDKIAKKHNINTPVNRTVYAALAPHEEGKR